MYFCAVNRCKYIRNLRTIQTNHQLFSIKVRNLRIMNKTESIIKAIKLNYRLKSNAEFARFLEVASTTVSSWKSRDSIDTDLVYAKCVGISAEFLRSGIGEAFPKKNKEDYRVISDLEESYKTPDIHKKIPLYDAHSVGGVQSVANVNDTNIAPSEWIDAGDWFPDATAAIRHYGDSMKEYPAGSILALKEVIDRSLLIWGRNYVIETTEYRVTKQLQDGGNDYIIGYSSNLDSYPDGKQIHSPIQIYKLSITKIYQVIGCVIKEYSNGAIKVR